MFFSKFKNFVSKSNVDEKPIIDKDKKQNVKEILYKYEKKTKTAPLDFNEKKFEEKMDFLNMKLSYIIL